MRSEAFELQSKGLKLKKFTFRDAWTMMFIFLLFVFVRTFGEALVAMFMSLMEPHLPEAMKQAIYIYTDGVATGFTGNATVVMTGIGFIIGSAAVLKKSLQLISEDRKRREELARFKPIEVNAEPKKGIEGYMEKAPVYVDIILFVLATIGAALGIGMLFDLSGVTSSENYQAVAKLQYSCAPVIGVIVYGLIAPAAEEIVFRGGIFNYLKRHFPIRLAALFAVFIFAFYHGNSAQTGYAFIMGSFICYGYEYFEDFRAALFIHMGANTAAYIMTYVSKAYPAVRNWGTALVLVAVAGVCVYLLNKKKPGIV